MTPLRFANPSPPSGWIEDFHLQAVDHARHTTKSPAIWRGFRSSCCSALAVLALLALLAWLLATLLLLAGLARLLATLLLLAGFLATLLLLAWVLVGILILTHSISFQRWLLPTPTSR
jgi:cation transporter-like permease